MTFDQQVQEGYRPVWQGERVVAMVLDNRTVRPGRRSEGGKDGKGGGKGWKGGKGKDGGKDGGSWTQLDGESYAGAPPRPPRWRVVHGQDAIMREAIAVESDLVTTLLSGTLVQQIGEDKVLKNGIVRMLVEAVEPQAGVKGWVTRSAEAAGGPVFFKLERGGPRESGAGGGYGGRPKGGGGGKGLGKKGRPVGEGEGRSRQYT